MVDSPDTRPPEAAAGQAQRAKTERDLGSRAIPEDLRKMLIPRDADEGSTDPAPESGATEGMPAAEEVQKEWYGGKSNYKNPP